MKIDQHKILNQISTLTPQTGATTYANKQKAITPESLEYINEIFKRLTAICPAWKQAFSNQDELEACKKEWIEGFYDAGIRSKSVVDYALNKLRQSGEAFIPPVGRFIEWCKDGSLPEGTKSCLDSYKEILGYMALPLESRKLNHLSPEVYHTLHSLHDFHGWKQSRGKRSKDIWFSEHERTMEVLRSGGSIKLAPPERVKISSNSKPLSKEKAIAGLRAMRAQL